MTKPIAPSTPAPLQRYDMVIGETCINQVASDDGDFVWWLDADAAITRERESRKQAEAALQRVERALTMALDSRELSKYVYAKIGELLRPIPQEPAERERGK